MDHRARTVTKREKSPKPSKNTTPFTSKVRMQQPSKLRNKPDHKPLTYGQVLSMHQEKTIHQEKSANEICKIYGTHRVPGLYKGYVKNTPRKAKTYQEMCKGLKPEQSQAKAHKFVPKVPGTRIINKAVSQQQRRFKPYNTSLDQSSCKIEDLSDWSLDENMKNILYNNATTTNIKKRVSYKDFDQDTLADTDGDYLLNDLLEEEKKNEKMYQNALRDLSNLDGDNACEDEYVNQVDIDDLKNFSLSSESAISSFIDWEQIDQMIGMK